MPANALPIRRLALAAAVLLAAASAHAGLPGPATLVLQDVPTRLALVEIAQLEDLDVVTSSALQDARTSFVATLPLRAAFDRIAQEAGAEVRIQSGGIRVVARPCAFARALAPVHVTGDWRRADFRLPGVERGSLLDILADYAQGPKRATPVALPPAVVGVRVRQPEARQLLWALQVAEGLEPASTARGPFDLRASTSASCPASAPQPQAAALYREDRPFAAYRLDELRMAGYLQQGDAIPIALILQPGDHLSILHVGDVLTADGAKVGAIYGDGVHLRAADGSAVDTPVLPFHAPGVALQPPLAAVRADAERGDARAQALLGQMLVRGNGTPRDIQAGTRWVERAAEQGDAQAQSALGNDYDLGLAVDKDPVRALAWHRRAAAQGVSASESDLGFALFFGEGAGNDPAGGLMWLERAAAHGETSAAWYAGESLLDVAPPLNDAVRGIAWLRRAAEDGDVQAQVRLADELAHGTHVTRDEAQAIEWYGRAVSRGSVRAAFGLGGLYFQHVPNRDDDLRAVDMFQYGAKLDARSQYALGAMALMGRGGPVDKAAAVRWFTASATQGMPAARDALATLLLAGDVERGAPLALPWLRAAALDTPGTQTPEQRERWTVPRQPLGYGPSQRMLGELLGSGFAGPIDIVQSWQWLTIADANGEPKAKRELALLRPRMTQAQVEEGTRRAAEWIAARTPAGK